MYQIYHKWVLCFQEFTKQLKKEQYEIIDRIQKFKIAPTGDQKDYDLHFGGVRTMLIEILEILRAKPIQDEEENVEIMYYDGPCRCNEFRGEVKLWKIQRKGTTFKILRITFC